MSQPTPAAVTCRGLVKRFGGSSGVLAVDGLDLDVPAGSVFGLLGPNGAGKTTTLRLVTGLARPTAGLVTIDGAPVSAGRGGLDARRGIGVLDQDPRYYSWMTGRELVALAGELQGLPAREARARADETLQLVGLADARTRRIAGYSGGMRQRLGIAQALVARPRLLVLDEPVSSLDPEGRRDLLALIADVRASATVIFSTHVLADVERICDRVAILDHGRLVTEGALEALLAGYASPLYRIDPEPGQEAALSALAATLRATAWVDGVTERDGRLTVSVTDEAAASAGLLPLVVAAGVRLAGFERVRPSLEDVFLRLVGREPDASPGGRAAA
ncbi:MAG TPA: ABC transporter ATP-binding protein [Candidatus Limnocylindrales bacterium]|nr:ABC transporter ATP-binding protein [Candidatus Limnocylindrales bacterium]